MPQHPVATLDLPGGARLTLASLDDLASPQVLKVLELMAARVNAPAAAAAPSAYPPPPAPAPAPTYAPIEPDQGKPPLVLVGVPWEWRDGPPLGAWVAACYAKEGWPFGGSTRKVYGALVSPSSVHPGWDGRFIGVNRRGLHETQRPDVVRDHSPLIQHREARDERADGAPVRAPDAARRLQPRAVVVSPGGR